MSERLGCSGPGGRTRGDVLDAEDDLLGNSPAHAHVHLGQQLGARLTPAVILREHGHLGGRREEERDEEERG